MGKNQHVVPDNGKWKVIGEGNKRATVIKETQKEAIQIGREISQNQKSELSIHRKDGTIREKNTYGKDPFPPKG